MAVDTFGSDYEMFIGEVLRQSAVRGDPDVLSYDIFLRGITTGTVHHLTDHKPRRRPFKNVTVVAAKPGDAVWAVKNRVGLYVFVPETVEFTENCD